MAAAEEWEYKYEITDNNPSGYLDRAVLRAAYLKYNAEVAATLSNPGQLLVFNVKEGWAPLCKHLGKPIPEGIPFPHVHNGVKVMAEGHVLWLVTWIWPLPFVLPAFFCVWRSTKRSRKRQGATSKQQPARKWK